VPMHIMTWRTVETSRSTNPSSPSSSAAIVAGGVSFGRHLESHYLASEEHPNLVDYSDPDPGEPGSAPKPISGSSPQLASLSSPLLYWVVLAPAFAYWSPPGPTAGQPGRTSTSGFRASCKRRGSHRGGYSGPTAQWRYRAATSHRGLIRSLRSKTEDQPRRSEPFRGE
jgi:hypothetical protein